MIRAEKYKIMAMPRQCSPIPKAQSDARRALVFDRLTYARPMFTWLVPKRVSLRVHWWWEPENRTLVPLVYWGYCGKRWNELGRDQDEVPSFICHKDVCGAAPLQPPTKCGIKPRYGTVEQADMRGDPPYLCLYSVLYLIDYLHILWNNKTHKGLL